MPDIQNQIDAAVGSEHDVDVDSLIRKERAAQVVNAMSLLSNEGFMRAMVDQAAIDERNTANARESQIQLLQAPQGSWLTHNIHSVLSLMTVVFILGVLAALMFSPVPISQDKKDVVLYVLGTLSSIVTLVLGYYFGSSSGSADKTKLINTIAR